MEFGFCFPTQGTSPEIVHFNTKKTFLESQVKGPHLETL